MRFVQGLPALTNVQIPLQVKLRAAPATRVTSARDLCVQTAAVNVWAAILFPVVDREDRI